MKLLLPDNIFSKIFLSELDPIGDLQTEFSPSAIISKRLLNEKEMIGIIPTLDLLTFKDLYVSREIGISFNALLSNSYIYFKEEQESIDEIFLGGNVTSNEVILGKILFKEFYDFDVKTTLLKNNFISADRNILMVGDDNFEKELFLKGLSFSEEIIELINAPYINFVLSSNSENNLKNFCLNYKDRFSEGHPEGIVKLFPHLPQSALDFIKVNLQHLVFDFDEQDVEGIKLLLQMPFYHGIIKDLIDVKFVRV